MKIANGTMFLSRNRNNGVIFHSVIILCARLCIAQQNRSIGVNVVLRPLAQVASSATGGAMLCSARKRIPTVAFAPSEWRRSTIAAATTKPLCHCETSPQTGRGNPFPYNNFTNYAVSICKRQEIIPQKKKNSFALCKGVFEIR